MSQLAVLVVVTCVFVSIVKPEAKIGEPCSEAKKSLVKFSINTHRNQSGIWQSKIGFSHRGGKTNMTKTETWSLDVEQSTTTTTTTCDEDEGIIIMATVTQVPDSSFLTKPIPADYELFPSVGYYKFHSENVNWARARQVCAEEGAHLIILNSENEANVVKQLFLRFPKEKQSNTSNAYDTIWIGVHEQGVNGQYITIFGNPLNSTDFQRWHPGHPNAAGSNDCILSYRTTAGLIDISCDTRAPFVCELPS